MTLLYRAAPLLAALSACSSERPQPAPSASAPASATAGPAGSAHDADVSPPKFDADWERARASGDAEDLDAVADATGALALTLALDDPTYGVTARMAIARAHDRELAIAPLAARAAAGDAERELETLAEVLATPSPIGERLDPSGVQTARGQVLAIASDTSRPPRVRALAITILRRLAARGVGEVSTIPTDLD